MTRRIRWAARGIGTFVAAYWLFIGVVSAVTGEEPWTWESAVLTGLVLVAIAGVAVTWRWERIGGVVLVIDGIALSVFGYISAGRNKALAVLTAGGPFLLAGVLFLLSWWRAQGGRHPRTL